MDIRLTKQKQFKNKYKQSTISMNNKNKSFLSSDDVYNLVDKVLMKKKENQKMMVRVLTPIGWLQYLSYGFNMEQIETVEDYLQGRVRDESKFSDKITQVEFTIIDTL